MQIYIYVYIDIYVWSYTNNRSVVHLDVDWTQHPSAVPRGPDSSPLWSPVILGKLGFLSFVLEDQEEHQCTWNHTALGTSWEEQGHHTGWLHTFHRAQLLPLVHHPSKEHLKSGAGCVCTAVVFPGTNQLLCQGTLQCHSGGTQGRALQSLLPSATPAPDPTASGHPGAIPQMLLFRAGWAFVFNL